MLNRFVKDARGVTADAQEEARAHGSASIEAEHVLLALARDATGLVAHILHGAGLDPPAIVDALDAEFERSLAAVGVAADGFGPLRVTPFTGQLRWGASAKAALQRSVEVAQERGDHRVGRVHILAGVLGAREGTLTRALRGAGVDPGDLAAETRTALSQA